LLLWRPVLGEGADRAEAAELHHVGAAWADGGDLLDGDDGVHERAALAAIGLANGDAHQPLLAHQLRHVERKARVGRALERIRLQMVERKAPHRVGEELLFLGEGEVHGRALIAQAPGSAARKRSRSSEGSKLRLNGAGSPGLTRRFTKALPL